MAIELDSYTKSPSYKGVDLAPEGETVTIQSVGEREFDDSKKIELSFVEDDRKMYLGKTQVRTMKELFGDNTDKWFGVKLHLASAPTQKGATIVINKATETKETEVEFA